MRACVRRQGRAMSPDQTAQVDKDIFRHGSGISQPKDSGLLESPVGLAAVLWGHEPWASPAGQKAPINRTHSRRFALFEDALKSRSVWSACVFSAAFPSQATIR